MKNLLPADILPRLGLSTQSIGDSMRLDLSVDDHVARGFAPANAAQDIASFVEQHEAMLLDAPAAESMDFRLAHFQEWPTLVRIWAPDESYRPVGAPGAQTLWSEGAGEFYLDLDTHPLPLALVDARGEGLIFTRDATALIVGQVLQLPAGVGESLKLSSPIESWLESSHDAWFISEIHQRIARNDPWQYLVAVGFYHRFWRAETPEERRQLVAQVLDGQRVEALVRAPEWARTLTPTTLERLITYTHLMLQELEGALQELADLLAKDELILQREVREAMHLRDDIESALILLDAAGQLDALRAEVLAVDDFGEQLIAQLLDEIDLSDDEQLFRAIACTPESWWTRLCDQEMQ